MMAIKSRGLDVYLETTKVESNTLAKNGPARVRQTMAPESFDFYQRPNDKRNPPPPSPLSLERFSIRGIDMSNDSTPCSDLNRVAVLSPSLCLSLSVR